jgi:hypothetical protein
LVASWAEGDNSEFWELQQCDVLATDLRMARLAGVTGSDPNARLDMRFLEYRLGAPDSPGMQVVTKPAPPVQQPAQPPPPRAAEVAAAKTMSANTPVAGPSLLQRLRGWLVPMGSTSLVAAFLLWLVSRRRKSRDAPRLAAAVTATKREFRCSSWGENAESECRQIGAADSLSSLQNCRGGGMTSGHYPELSTGRDLQQVWS